MRLRHLLAATLAMSALAYTQQQPEPAEVIFVNGNIYAGVEWERGEKGLQARTLPRVQALAVSGGKVVAAGTDAEIRRLRGKQTQVVDLGGRFVVPGFNDAHAHLASGGFEQLNVSLTGTRSLDEMKHRIAERVKSAAPGEWITGRGWDHTKWTTQQLPTRQDMDAVTGRHPAVFNRTDGHILVANSEALRISGIDRNTPDPPGGAIDRAADGEPTGILREKAMALLAERPAPAPSQRRRAVLLALEEAARHGLTSVQDNSDWEDYLVYEDLLREGKLTLRITEWLPFGTPLETLQRHRARRPQSDPQLRTGMLKGYMDGTLGSRTAAMLKEYSDDPGNTGLLQHERDRLMQMTAERVLAGFQIGFHAIGDRGAEWALDAFENAQRAVREQQTRTPESPVGRGDFRFRIEHAQVVQPEHYARMRALGVVASMQPNHLLTDMNWAESRIGAERAKNSYPWRAMLDHGIPLAFGTDYPVEPLTPFRGLYAALTRKNEEGTTTYVPAQAVTIDEALGAYTSGAAYAEFAEKEKGVLKPGYWADFVVLDRDLTKASPEEVLDTRVLLTVVGGKTVFPAEK